MKFKDDTYLPQILKNETFLLSDSNNADEFGVDNYDQKYIQLFDQIFMGVFFMSTNISKIKITTNLTNCVYR